MYVMIGYSLAFWVMSMYAADNNVTEQMHAHTKLLLAYAGKWEDLRQISKVYKEYQLLQASCDKKWDKVKAIVTKHHKTISLDIADDKGNFPLWCAVQAKRHDMIRFLLEQKANPNRTFQSKNRNIIALRNNGNTALFKAAYQGDINAALLLLDGGASVNVANNIGSTPLFAAVYANSLPMAQLLLRRGANPNVQEKMVCIIDNDPISAVGGDTPLIFAAAKNALDMVELLLGAGANNIEAKNVSGKTARLRAELHGNERMFQLLTHVTPKEYDEPDHAIVSFVRPELWIN